MMLTQVLIVIVLSIFLGLTPALFPFLFSSFPFFFLNVWIHNHLCLFLISFVSFTAFSFSLLSFIFISFFTLVAVSMCLTLSVSCHSVTFLSPLHAFLSLFSRTPLFYHAYCHFIMWFLLLFNFRYYVPNHCITMWYFCGCYFHIWNHVYCFVIYQEIFYPGFYLFVIVFCSILSCWFQCVWALVSLSTQCLHLVFSFLLHFFMYFVRKCASLILAFSVCCHNIGMIIWMRHCAIWLFSNTCACISSYLLMLVLISRGNGRTFTTDFRKRPKSTRGTVRKNIMPVTYVTSKTFDLRTR